MNARTVEVTIAPDGELDIQAVGFHGADCQKATAFLEAALGKVADRHRKPEYFQRAQQRGFQRVGQ
jgi:hypothetical protein